MIKIHLRKSKCDQFGNGADILLGRTGCELCLVSAIMTFIGLRRSTPGHFFVDHQEKPIVKSHFVAKVRDALRTAGYPEEQFAGPGCSHRIIGESYYELMVTGVIGYTVRPNFRSGGPYSLREYGPPRTQLPREYGPPDRVPWLYKTN